MFPVAHPHFGQEIQPTEFELADTLLLMSEVYRPKLVSCN